MPGRNLSNDEQHLLDFWESPPGNSRCPLLRAIEIGGDTGLRSLKGVRVPFNYPVTAICGKNGTGKSTVLALAALAFHAPPAWYVHWTNARHRASRTNEDRSYYIFPDFFVQGRGEAVPNGVEITWRYLSQGAQAATTFRKRARNWGRYSARPVREVAYSPLSRVLPAHEMNAVRGAFSNPGPGVTRQQFDEQYRGYLAYVLGTNYQAVTVEKTNRLNFSSCSTDITYSAFNMGGGEGCVIELLFLLMKLPPFGLLVVEEIESCLHPEAQIRLAAILIKIARQKKIQVICSTHSQVFLDALPRQARLLLLRENNDIVVVENPSTRFAVYQMTGEVQPELTIYCEDDVAAVLINETLTYSDRRRLRVVDVGSDATVIKQAICHLRGDFPGQCLCVLDGDCTPQQVRGWIASERGADAELVPAFEILPGDSLSPERWVLSQLAHEDYRNQFADQLGCLRDQASEHVTEMQVEIDHHNVAYILGRRTGLEESDCVRRLMRSVAQNHPALAPLKARISALLGE
jgi:predicted ATPase